jgi:hypothetical protein
MFVCLPRKRTKSGLSKNTVGTLTEMEGSVQLTSSLSKLDLLKRLKTESELSKNREWNILKQGTLTELESSVQLTSTQVSLFCLKG